MKDSGRRTSHGWGHERAGRSGGGRAHQPLPLPAQPQGSRRRDHSGTSAGTGHPAPPGRKAAAPMASHGCPAGTAGSRDSTRPHAEWPQCSLGARKQACPDPGHCPQVLGPTRAMLPQKGQGRLCPGG